MSVSQTTFRAALLDASQPIPVELADSSGRQAGARFNVYRNNVAVSLTEALHTGFPIVAKLLGKENMDGLAGLFLRSHPPTSPLLMHYGDTFPAFLAELPQLAHLGYLPDVARLELALRRSYHATDSVPIEPQCFGAVSPEDLMRSTLTLAPSVELIRSEWPLYDIWRFNTEDNSPKPVHVAQDVLITREEFDPVPQLLPAGGAAWIGALTQGATIGIANEDAHTTTPDFDLTTCLTLLLSGGAIVSLTKKE